jgi:hypothetical protein
MKRAFFIFYLLVLTATNLFSQQSEFPKLTGPNLGQKPPGMIPEIFAPGIVSRDEFKDYGITFSKKNDLMLFTCDSVGSNKHNIFFCTIEKGVWTEPKPIPFSYNQSIGEPVFSSISDKIFYAQDIMNAANEREPFLYFTRKKENGWALPQPIMPGLFASEANDGTLYFTNVTKGEKPLEKADIMKSEFIGEKYLKPEIVKGNINTEYNEFHPFIASDESFMIFDSNRPRGFGGYDIYISFKDAENKWGVPINFGNRINSSEFDGVATLSSDGKYIFYTHNHQDIYWVSAKIIEDLKPKELK